MWGAGQRDRYQCEGTDVLGMLGTRAETTKGIATITGTNGGRKEMSEKRPMRNYRIGFVMVAKINLVEDDYYNPKKERVVYVDCDRGFTHADASADLIKYLKASNNPLIYGLGLLLEKSIFDFDKLFAQEMKRIHVEGAFGKTGVEP